MAIEPDQQNASLNIISWIAALINTHPTNDITFDPAKLKIMTSAGQENSA
jgi:hypothetical protein